jgi:hypothetical protein
MLTAINTKVSQKIENAITYSNGINNADVNDMNDDNLNTITKSKIAVNEEVSISKNYDPRYKSTVIGIQEFVPGSELTEVVRSYDNNAVASFKPNPFVTFDGGLKLLASKTIHMDVINNLSDGVLYGVNIDLSGYTQLGVNV